MATTLAGVFPAVWTPTGADGQLLTRELRGNMEFMRKHGVHGFMALGSTGEFPFLDVATRKRVLEEIVQAAGGLPVVANISDIRPGLVAELGRFAGNLGVNAVAVLPPSFYRLGQSDLVEFFVRAAEAAAVPMVLYNFPERTGVRIELETIMAVASRVSVIGFKQSGGEFAYHADLIKLGQELGFVVFSGADTRFGEALTLGARGSISGMANAVPELMVQIFEAHESGSPRIAEEPSARMKALEPLIDGLSFPLNIHALMTARGLPTGTPKQIVSQESLDQFARLVTGFSKLFREWRLT